MDRTVQQWQIPEGTDVYGADGDKVGKVVAAEANYIVVEKGFFFPTDYYIPTGAISNFDGDRVYLSVTKDEALNQGWDQNLSTVDTTYDTSGTYATTGVTTEADRLAGVTPTGLADQAEYAGTTAATSDLREGETIRVPLLEEELTATKRPVERGHVRLQKDVVAEEQTMDVPGTEERLVVNRRVVDRDATGVDATAYAEDTIEIPLLSEEVDVQKRDRVVEEIEIGKEKVQRTERVAGTVRREEVRVDEASVDPTTGATS
jgi:uncharacterized protein (TIGR02271 family)